MALTETSDRVDGEALDNARLVTFLDQRDLEDFLNTQTPPQIAELVDDLQKARVELEVRLAEINSAIPRVSETAHTLVNGARPSEQPQSVSPTPSSR